MHSVNESTTDGWQELANCLGVDPDLFFPERGASTQGGQGGLPRLRGP